MKAFVRALSVFLTFIASFFFGGLICKFCKAIGLR